MPVSPGIRSGACVVSPRKGRKMLSSRWSRYSVHTGSQMLSIIVMAWKSATSHGNREPAYKVELGAPRDAVLGRFVRDTVPRLHLSRYSVVPCVNIRLLLGAPPPSGRRPGTDASRWTTSGSGYLLPRCPSACSSNRASPNQGESASQPEPGTSPAVRQGSGATHARR